MNADQYRNILDRLDMTQADASRIMGANSRTGRRWALGECPVPTPVAILMRLMSWGAITPDDVEEALGNGDALGAILRLLFDRKIKVGDLEKAFASAQR